MSGDLMPVGLEDLFEDVAPSRSRLEFLPFARWLPLAGISTLRSPGPRSSIMAVAPVVRLVSDF